MKTITQLFCTCCIFLFATGCDPVSEWLFVKTASESEATAMHLTLPANDSQEAFKKQPNDQLYMVVLQGKQNVSAYYESKSPENFRISDLNAKLKQGKNVYKNNFVVIIKPSKASEYKELIDVLDLMKVNNIQRYSLEELK